MAELGSVSFRRGGGSDSKDFYLCQSVQVRLICIYVCPTSAHRGFRYGYRRYKDNTFILETTWFGRKSMILRFGLTLFNTNMSKKSTFA